MKIALFALTVIAAVAAHAEDPVSKPYVLINGKGVDGPSQPTTAGGNMTAGTQGSAFGTTQVAPSVLSQAAAASAAAGVAQAALPAKNFTGSGHAHKASAHRGIAGAQTPAGNGSGGSGSATEGAPPAYLSKPGALIRTEGQQPKYADPGPARALTVEGGGFIDIDARRARDVGRAPGVRWGAPDKAPSTNGDEGAGGSAVTANGPAIPDGGSGKSDNGVGNAGVPGNGGANNPAAGSAAGFDPSF